MVDRLMVVCHDRCCFAEAATRVNSNSIGLSKIRDRPIYFVI